MNGWHYGSRLEAFYRSDGFYAVIFAFLAVALVFVVVYFIDGMRKYGYWLHEGKKDEG